VAEYWFGWVRLTAENATHLRGEFVEAGGAAAAGAEAGAGGGGAVLDEFVVVRGERRQRGGGAARAVGSALITQGHSATE